MAIIETASLPWFKAARFSLGLDVNESAFQGFYTGNRQTQSTLSDRLTGLLTLPSTNDAEGSAEQAAILFQLRSRRDYLRMAMPHLRRRIGTMGGTVAAAASAIAGAQSIAVSGCRPGNNLFLRAQAFAVYGSTGWTATNGTVTGGQTDPNGTAFAQVLTRASAANHSAYQTLTISTHNDRSAVFEVYLKRGTLTGTVTLRLRDGAGTEVASETFNPTTDWAPYRLEGAFGATPAANIQVHIDPDENVGSIGDTLYFWNAWIEVIGGRVSNSVIDLDIGDAPSGYGGAGMQLRSTGAGDTWWYRSLTRTIVAGEQFTFSVWLKAGTLGGNVAIQILDHTSATIDSSTVTPTGTWVRHSITATMPATTAITVGVNPSTLASAAGQTVLFFGAQLEVGTSVSTHYTSATLAAGEFIATGGNLLMVGYGGATADALGAATVPLALPLPKAVSSSASVLVEGATGLWEWDGDSPQFDYSPGDIQGPMVIPLRQVIA